MSIKIDPNKCISCGKCCDICPGNLLQKDEEQKAFIQHPQDCWGCTACLKECQTGAIKYYLGADIGGIGGYLYTEHQKGFIYWYIISPEGEKHQITINQHESNKY